MLLQQKLLQRLGYEGIEVSLGGIITLVATRDTLKTANDLLGRIDNQNLRNEKRRVF